LPAKRENRVRAQASRSLFAPQRCVLEAAVLIWLTQHLVRLFAGHQASTDAMAQAGRREKELNGERLRIALEVAGRFEASVKSVVDKGLRGDTFEAGDGAIRDHLDQNRRRGATHRRDGSRASRRGAAHRRGGAVQFINHIPSRTNLQEWSDATRDIAANLQQSGAGATVAPRTVAAGSETATANRAAVDEMHAATGLAEGRRGEVARFLEQVRAACRLSVPSRRL
jgi:hypothetical protein